MKKLMMVLGIAVIANMAFATPDEESAPIDPQTREQIARTLLSSPDRNINLVTKAMLENCQTMALGNIEAIAKCINQKVAKGQVR